MRYAHAQSSYGEAGQQQNYFDGYTRYSHGQLHHHHNGNYSGSFNGHYGAMRENYHAGSEGSGQYYYQNNAHQTPTSYYGNHSYESYRNAPSGYQYNHYGSGGGGFHQAAPHPTQYYSSYNQSPTEQFNNRYYPTPPPSAPPTASQRDPYHVHSNDGAPSSSYAPPIGSESSEKLNSERLSADCDKGSLNDPIASLSPIASSSPALKQSTENEEIVENDKKPEVQQTELEKSSPHEASPSSESEKLNTENASEGVKVDGNLDSVGREQKTTKHENQHQQSTSLFNENCDRNQHHPCNESLTKANGANSHESTVGGEVENSLATCKWKTKTRIFMKLSIFTG